MDEKFSLIPDDIDILITHTPPEGILDNGPRGRLGCSGLRKKVEKMDKLKLHLFGHIHEGFGMQESSGGMKFINASFVNEHYNPINTPIRVIL